MTRLLRICYFKSQMKVIYFTHVIEGLTQCENLTDETRQLAGVEAEITGSYNF